MEVLQQDQVNARIEDYNTSLLLTHYFEWIIFVHDAKLKLELFSQIKDGNRMI